MNILRVFYRHDELYFRASIKNDPCPVKREEGDAARNGQGGTPLGGSLLCGVGLIPSCANKFTPKDEKPHCLFPVTPSLPLCTSTVSARQGLRLCASTASLCRLGLAFPSSRPFPSVISTFPFRHLDLPLPSSRPSPSVISTEGRDLNEPRIPSHDNSKIPRRCAPRNDRKEMWSSRKFPTEQVEESLLN